MAINYVKKEATVTETVAVKGEGQKESQYVLYQTDEKFVDDVLYETDETGMPALNVDDSVVAPLPEKEDLATVAVNMGMTVNLGNYNSAKIGVILTMPTELAAVDSTYEFTKKWVDDRVNELVGEILEEKNGNSKPEVSVPQAAIQ